MKPNFPFIEGLRGQSFFWIREKVKDLRWMFMDPSTDDPIQFWLQYIDYVILSKQQFSLHISYRADSSKCKCKWLSGLIIDSDISLTIDIAALKRMTVCGDCDDPMVCERCKEMQQRLIENYNNAPNK